MTDTDYEKMCSALLTLLDRVEIENAAGNGFEVHALCQQRFDIAEEHGMTVEFTGEEASGTIQ